MFNTLLVRLEKGIVKDMIMLDRLSNAVSFIQFTFCVLLKNDVVSKHISSDDSQDELGHILSQILLAMDLLSNIEKDGDLDKRN